MNQMDQPVSKSIFNLANYFFPPTSRRSDLTLLMLKVVQRLDGYAAVLWGVPLYNGESDRPHRVEVNFKEVNFAEVSSTVLGT